MIFYYGLKMHYLSTDGCKIIILLKEKFKSERGRINCSLWQEEGWRWLGIQYVIEGY